MPTSGGEPGSGPDEKERFVGVAEVEAVAGGATELDDRADGLVVAEPGTHTTALDAADMDLKVAVGARDIGDGVAAGKTVSAQDRDELAGPILDEVF